MFWKSEKMMKKLCCLRNYHELENFKIMVSKSSRERNRRRLQGDSTTDLGKRDTMGKAVRDMKERERMKDL